MTSTPRVSVCMITYNHEKYIAQALESVLAQKTDFDFEIVIGEDCSSDGTRAIIEEYARRHPDRIRPLLRPKNFGMIENFLDAYANCRGEFIAILEGDDYWTSAEKLAKQVELMVRDPRIAISHHAVDILADDGRVIGRTPIAGCKPAASLEGLLKIRGLAIQTCSVVLRRELLGARLPRWLTECRSGDWPLYVYSASKGAIAFVDEVMAVYRKHDGGIWTGASQVQRVQRALETNLAVRRNLPADRAGLMSRRLSWNHADLSLAYASAGDRATARTHALISLRMCPGNVLRTPKLTARMLVAAFGPGWRAAGRPDRAPELVPASLSPAAARGGGTKEQA